MSKPDFITVQLSKAGVAFAGEHGVVRINNARREFDFKAGEPQEVLRAYEWDKVLSPMQANGEAMFEVAPQADEHSSDEQPNHEGKE